MRLHQTGAPLAKVWPAKAAFVLSEHNEPALAGPWAASTPRGKAAGSLRQDRHGLLPAGLGAGPIITCCQRHTCQVKLPMSRVDRVLACADNALRTLSGAYVASADAPAPASPDGDEALAADAAALTPEQRRLSAALMRVNHVGEICAQALYNAQSLATEDAGLHRQFDAAAREEFDHLAWTRQRLQQLDDRTSWLNPLWYAGAFGIGLLAGRLGPGVSLGFVAETEDQVEQHLRSHLERLPEADQASRAIVQRMIDDESRHAANAREAGAVELPAPVKLAMRLAAKVMTRTAHHV